MAEPWSLQFGSVNMGMPTPQGAQVRDPQAPFRILVLGDFSGRSSRAEAAPASGWKPVKIDRDNFEEAMAALGVEIRLTLSGLAEPITLRFAELDDFHPDRLFERVSIFEDLRQLRRRLKNPTTFARAAEEVRQWAGIAAPTEKPAAPKASDYSETDLLDIMLGGAPPPTPTRQVDPFDDYVRKLVEPYSLPSTSADEKTLTAIVDEVSSARMRSILHHPAFQTLEAAWRSLYFLVKRLDTDGGLKLYLLDLSQAELAADLSNSAALDKSKTYRTLVEQPLGTPGGVPWAVLIGNYTFEPTLHDAALLARVGHIAQHAGAPFLAGASAAFVGCSSFAETPDPDDWTTPLDLKVGELWAALRQIPQAAHLGLALPRFLLRLPYGKAGSASETFPFEEMLPSANHENFLWGNPAFACGCLLGQAYEQLGWSLRPGAVMDVEGLPTYVRDVDGERELLPCGEILLRDRGANVLVENGFIPVQSIQNSDGIRIARFPSFADPAKPLAGRW